MILQESSENCKMSFLNGNISGNIGDIPEIGYQSGMSDDNDVVINDDEFLLPAAIEDAEVIYNYKPTNFCEKYCCGSIPNMACGYPSGTVRAIIAVFTLVVVLSVQSFAIVWLLIQDNTSGALGLATGLLGELGVVSGFYYGSRSSSRKKGDNGESLKVIHSSR